MGLFRDRDSTPLQTDNIRVPVLIIWGENDSWVSPEQAALWTDALPQSQLFWVPEGGHNPMETQTALFNHRLLEFLIAVDE
jgi:pimeloyl-ACP methyl ester carboxylesterase